MFGNVFYRGYDFACDDNVHVLLSSKLNSNVGKFICDVIKKAISTGYSYGKQFRLKTLLRLKINLPLISKESPNYSFMEQLMHKKEHRKLEEYHSYIATRLIANKSFEVTPPLSTKVWGEFFIEDVFHIKAGKRLTKSEMNAGDTPFIGASDSHNGITAYVSNINSSLDKNVLGVNYNGSVVENFYHPYKAVFSDDVKRLTFKNTIGNRFLFLFAKVMILQQKSKYQYAYKFNESRMLRQKILLPIDATGEPDYPFMENYAKKIEFEKLSAYALKKQLQPSE